MKPPLGRRTFDQSLWGVFIALLLTGTLAHAQGFYQNDWTGPINNSAGDSDTQDNWVANSFTVRSGSTHIASITLPIADSFNNQPITALIYKGSDYVDPTAGLTLLSQTDTTFTSVAGTILTINLTNPLDLNVGDDFYAAVLIPGVPPLKYPFYVDKNRDIGQSFFDVGLTSGAAYDVNQGSANITPFGGTHPVVGNAVPAGTLALWVNATTATVP